MDGTGMLQEPAGVSQSMSRCNSNKTAYEIEKSALLSVDTAILFPKGFPDDFSVLIVTKPREGNRSSYEINFHISMTEFESRFRKYDLRDIHYLQ